MAQQTMYEAGIDPSARRQWRRWRWPSPQLWAAAPETMSCATGILWISECAPANGLPAVLLMTPAAFTR